MPSIAFPPDDTTTGLRRPPGAMPSVPARPLPPPSDPTGDGRHACPPHARAADQGQGTTDPARAQRNRRNAAKSTGPRTPEGKARSAQNARTHNLTATTPPPSLLQDPTYRQAKQELVDELRPTTPMQQVLVSQLAHLTWQLDQVPTLEHHILTMPGDPSQDSGLGTRDSYNRLAAHHLLENQPTPVTRLWDHHRRLLTHTQSLLRQLLHLQQHEHTRQEDDAALDARLDRNQRAERLNAAERAAIEQGFRARTAADAPPSEISNLKSATTPPAQTRQTPPTCSNAPQTTPPTTPAQNEPTLPTPFVSSCLRGAPPSPRSVSSVSSVAEHSPSPAPQSATPRNTAQQNPPPAQNEPTPSPLTPLPSPPPPCYTSPSIPGIQGVPRCLA